MNLKKSRNIEIFSTRGQVSIEYITLLGVLLIAVGFLAGYAFLMYNNSVSLNLVKDSVLDLKKGINTVNALGDGSSLIVEISLPNDVSDIHFTDNAIIITSNSFGSSSTDTIVTDATLSGTLPISAGSHSILITNTGGAVTLNEV